MDEVKDSDFFRFQVWLRPNSAALIVSKAGCTWLWTNEFVHALVCPAFRHNSRKRGSALVCTNFQVTADSD